MEVIMAKYGEIALKGLNRSNFEDLLVKNIRRRLDKLGKYDVTRRQSTIYIIPVDENSDLDAAVKKSKPCFRNSGGSAFGSAPKGYERDNKAVRTVFKGYP